LYEKEIDKAYLKREYPGAHSVNSLFRN